MKWRHAQFREVVNSRGAGSRGLPQSEWEEEGEYPVIGQGSDFIEGWTNRRDLLLTPKTAVVLYGGHTRRTKLVETPFVPGPNVKILEPEEGLSAKFLYHFLAQLPIESRGYADHFPEVRRCMVPLPPLPEQRRIAAVLDKADDLRAKRRAALAELDTLTQSIFLDLFGDPKSSSWAMATVADIVDEAEGGIRTGPFGSQLLHSEFSNTGVAVLGIDNAVANEFRWNERRFISESKYRQLKRYTVRPGDVLITIMGTCGRCAVVPDDIPIAINTKHLCCITLNQTKCLPLFLHAYFLQHPIARKYLNQTAKGAIMSGLNMGIIKQMPVPLPPLELQHDFTRRVTAIKALKSKHRTALAELDALFASLQHRAFSGQL